MSDVSHEGATSEEKNIGTYFGWLGSSWSGPCQSNVSRAGKIGLDKRSVEREMRNDIGDANKVKTMIARQASPANEHSAVKTNCVVWSKLSYISRHEDARCVKSVSTENIDH